MKKKKQLKSTINNMEIGKMFILRTHERDEGEKKIIAEVIAIVELLFKKTICTSNLLLAFYL